MTAMADPPRDPERRTRLLEIDEIDRRTSAEPSMPPLESASPALIKSPGRSATLTHAPGFVLFALRKLASPMRVFAMCKAGALATFFAGLFPGKLSASSDAAGISLELLASEPGSLQVVISGLLVAGLVLANLALMRRREEAAAERIREIVSALKDPNVPADVKSTLANQILQDR